jgi:Gram-negative bacterial TonB protein C-terminal
MVSREDGGVPLEMRVLVFAVLVSSLLWSDLEQKVENRVYLSETLGNSLIKYRIRPICPYDACSRCANAEVALKLVVKKGGIVKQVTVTRASNSRLAQAALDAVSQWRYERYVLNGSPVEYETHATIKSWKCGT